METWAQTNPYIYKMYTINRVTTAGQINEYTIEYKITQDTIIINGNSVSIVMNADGIKVCKTDQFFFFKKFASNTYHWKKQNMNILAYKDYFF